MFNYKKLNSKEVRAIPLACGIIEFYRGRCRVAKLDKCD